MNSRKRNDGYAPSFADHENCDVRGRSAEAASMMHVPIPMSPNPIQTVDMNAEFPAIAYP
jgi:hypothetical protein